MSEKILIFGKDTWPYTVAAREAYAMEGKEVEYIDVLSDSEKLNTMLTHTEGKRQVPVIVEGNQVTIGFNGSYWGVWIFLAVCQSQDPWQPGL